MKNMKVSKKLIVGFLIVVVMAVIVGAVGIIGMQSITRADTELYESNTIAVSVMGAIRENLQRQRVATREMVVYAGDHTKLQQTKDKLTGFEKDMVELMAAYELTIDDVALEQDYFDAKKIYTGEYVNIKSSVAEASAISFEEGLRALEDPEVSTLTDSMINGFTASMDNNDAWAKEKSDDNDALAMQMTVIEIIVLAGAVLVAMYLAVHISRLISKPLIVLTNYLKKVSETGNMTMTQEDKAAIDVYARIKDEIGQCLKAAAAFVSRLLDIGSVQESIANGDLTQDLHLLSNEDTMGISIQKMTGNLNSMFGEIRSSAAQVSTGSKQIADGAQSLAQGSTEQAAAVQELSASISEIADKTRQNAKIAREAAGLSDTIKDSAEKGSVQMDQMMTAVKEINDASNEIEKVIKAIDDIAFQTNILALNAAVEAARAGSAGKGFAVVAEEVRNLAAKSADAARNTGGLIENSVSKANLGLNIATETSASLKEIVEGINKSADIITQIALSSDEQAGAISQVNTGIDQVAQVVQQNSATAQESAAASQEMSGQSDMLDQLISQFKIKESGYRSIPAVDEAPRRSIPQTSSASSSYATDGGDYGKY